MYKHKKKKEKKYLITLLVIFLLLMLVYWFSGKDGNYLYVEKIFKGLGARIQNIFVPKIEYDVDEIINGINRELQEENEELKRIINLNNGQYNFICADVIERSTNWYNEIRINKGEDDGIKTDMAVTSNDGLIGKVSRTGKHFSEIKLLSSNSKDMKVAVDIKNENNTYHGILNGYDMQDGTVNVENISKNSDVEIGDKVYTNGLGGIYPNGIYIGKVVNVFYDALGLEKNVKVKNDFTFDKLRYVCVVDRGN